MTISLEGNSPTGPIDQYGPQELPASMMSKIWSFLGAASIEEARRNESRINPVEFDAKIQ